MPAIAPQVVSWPADNVERWPVDRLVPNARNARTHSEAQVDQIAAAIREWGWTTPVLVSEAGTIIAGHGRVRAARKLALAEVPVMVAAGWSKAQSSGNFNKSTALVMRPATSFGLQTGKSRSE